MISEGLTSHLYLVRVLAAVDGEGRDEGGEEAKFETAWVRDGRIYVLLEVK